jgi:hypothetical protein
MATDETRLPECAPCRDAFGHRARPQHEPLIALPFRGVALGFRQLRDEGQPHGSREAR